MALTSLLRVPFLLLTWYSNEVCLRRPAARSSVRTHERVKNSDMSWLLIPMNLLNSALVPTIKTIVATTVIAEALCSVAASLPSTSPIPRATLQYLPGLPSIRPYISPLFLLGVFLTALGAYIRSACMRELGAHFTYELSIRDKHQLVRTGPYAIVRHPAYVGSMLVSVGITLVELAPGTWWTEGGVLDTGVGRVIACAWAAVTLFKVTLLARAPKEDAMLRKHFGKEWDAYARDVRWWYIPGLI